MVRRCGTCGGAIEGPGGNGQCYGCFLNSLIPVDYIRREKYIYASDDPVGGHRTCRPATGVELLDMTPPRVSKFAALLKGAKRQ